MMWFNDTNNDGKISKNPHRRKCAFSIACVIIGLLICGIALGVGLGLHLGSTSNNDATTISSTSQANASTTVGQNTATTMVANITSLSTSSTNTILINSSTLVPTISMTTNVSLISTSSTASIATPTTSTTSITWTSSTTSITPTTSTTSTTSITPTTSTTSTTTAPTYCPNWTWNGTGIIVAGTGTSGSALNALNQPWNIFIDSLTDILYVADSLNHRIIKYLPNATSGIVVAGTGSSSSLSNGLNTPKDVFVDSSGNIFVADSVNHRIQFFPNGSLTASTISTTWNVGTLNGVFFYNKTTYASDFDNSAVWANSTAVAGNQGAGSNLNQLNQPQGFTIDTQYNKSTMYIANSNQHTIVQWLPGASAGTIVAGINGVRNGLNTTFDFPLAIKLDSYANLFIADNNNHRIQLYCRYPNVSSTGRTIAGTSGISGSTQTLLKYPAGLALDSLLNLYVSDTSNNRVLKFMRIT
ncbi:unnamed protein product [Rotaria socialis]|uniref:NHL repeat containing protein n=1 Tax=Rotaria socialis TaxID=392032 RepID=A0A821T8L2_9BILA|nr:unnamed protein product [Rotaria socialis]CAF4872170.1 unnamed protein product [Rotaria socialis]